MKPQRSTSRATRSPDARKDAPAERTIAAESDSVSQTEVEGLADPQYGLAANDPVRGSVAKNLQMSRGNAYVQRLFKGGNDSAGGQTLPDATQAEIEAERGKGQALPSDVRMEMEPVLGRSFEDVNIHADAVSSAMAESMSARAFTTGSDVFFADGAYDPASDAGKQTIAHELTHVVQNRGASPAEPGSVSAPQDASEREADAVADGVMSEVSAGPGGAVQLEPDPLSDRSPQGDNIKAIEGYMATAEARAKLLDDYATTAFQLAETTLRELTTLSETYTTAYGNFRGTLNAAEQDAKDEQYYTDLVLDISCGVLIGLVAAAFAPAGAALWLGMSAGELAVVGGAAVVGEAASAGMSKLMPVEGQEIDTSSLDATFLENKMLKQVMGIYRISQQFAGFRQDLGARALTLSKMVTSLERYNNGGEVAMTPEEIDAEVETLSVEDEDWAWVDDDIPAATSAVQDALTAAQQLNTAQYNPDDMERTLWIVWTASLPVDSNILDLPSIELKLSELKLAGFGSYTWDDEEDQAIVRAKELAAGIQEDPLSIAMNSWGDWVLYRDVEEVEQEERLAAEDAEGFYDYTDELAGSDELEEGTGGETDTEGEEEEATATAQEAGPSEDEFVGPPSPNSSEGPSIEPPAAEANYSEEIEDTVDYSQMASFEDENDR